MVDVAPRGPRPLEEVMKDMDARSAEFLDKIADIHACVLRLLIPQKGNK